MKRIAFFGTPVFAAAALESLLGISELSIAVTITQPDAPQGRGRKLLSSPVKALAVSKGIPVLQPQRIKKKLAEFLGELDQYGPYDGAVVAAFGQILPSELLNYFERRCINVHASLLPRLRGAAPIQRAILQGEPSSGISLMQMEEGLDSGPVFVDRAVPLAEATTGGSLHDELATLGASLLREFVLPILDGTLSPVQQNAELATYAAKISHQDLLIDWHESAEQIARHVRAFAPRPHAGTFFRGARIKIGSAVSAERESSSAATPGEILRVERSGVAVCCGSGVLTLLSLQAPGRTMVTADEFSRSVTLQKGERFQSTQSELSEGNPHDSST